MRKAPETADDVAVMLGPLQVGLVLVGQALGVAVRQDTKSRSSASIARSCPAAIAAAAAWRARASVAYMRGVPRNLLAAIPLGLARAEAARFGADWVPAPLPLRGYCMQALATEAAL